MMDYIAFICDTRVLLLFLGIYLIYKFGKRKHYLHLKLGREGPRPLPFIGNFLDVQRLGFHELDKINLQKYGRIYPFYFVNIPQIVVADAELLKQIMIKESKCFTDRMTIFTRGRTIERMLNVLKGKDWERVRNLVSPTFTSGKLRKMTPLISDGMELLRKRIEEYPADTPIDFKEFFGALTMDVIARTMFGMKIDSQTNANNLFISHAKKLISFSFSNPIIMIFLLFPELDKPVRKLFRNTELRSPETFKFFNDALEKAITKRQQSTEQYNDFLALMLKAHKEIDENDPDQIKNIGSKCLTIHEIMSQSLMFLLAGYDTTSSTLTYLTFFLAKNPSAQQELYDEILDTFGIGGEINYESLMNIPLLDAAINETLRICPPAVRTDRQCTQDVTLTTSDNTKIFAKKGEIYTIPIYAIHSDPSIWTDPDVFDLHRFDPENKKNYNAYSFIPFGMGPRNCVGMRFALLEIKWAIVNILQRFEIVPCAETLDKLQFGKSRLTAPIKPILLKIKKRQ